MPNSYLDLAQTGKNHWWRYWLGMLLILIIWIYGGGLFALGLMKFVVRTGDNVTPFINYTTEKLQDMFAILAVFLTLKWLHQRKLSTLISIEGKLSLMRLCLGAVVWLLLICLVALRIWLIDSLGYKSIFVPRQWFVLFLVAIVMTTVQSAGEELIFRGYLLQGLNRFTRQPIISAFLSSLVFAYWHFLNVINPFLIPKAEFLSYVLWGVFTSIVTLRDNRIELAIGVHTATNLFFLLIVQSADSPFTTAILKNISNHENLTLAWVLLIMMLFYSIFFILPEKLSRKNTIS